MKKVLIINSNYYKVISQNLETPTILDLITSQEIYLPIIAFVVLVLVSLFLRKIFYK